MPVILINPFEVPTDDEERFLRLWHETASAVSKAPGFIEAHLHCTLMPGKRFRFVNVARWESETAFHDAFRNFEPSETQENVHAFPALYQVVASY